MAGTNKINENNFREKLKVTHIFALEAEYVPLSLIETLSHAFERFRKLFLEDPFEKSKNTRTNTYQSREPMTGINHESFELPIPSQQSALQEHIGWYFSRYPCKRQLILNMLRILETPSLVLGGVRISSLRKISSIQIHN